MYLLSQWTPQHPHAHCIHTYMLPSIRTHTHTHTHASVYTYTHTHTHASVYTYTHTHTHASVYTYTHTHTHTKVWDIDTKNLVRELPTQNHWVRALVTSEKYPPPSPASLADNPMKSFLAP